MASGMDSRQVGKRGEAAAAEFLMKHGYHVLATNWRWRGGEIDIVAQHHDDLVFVEVKTRRSHAFGIPEEAITGRKRQKLIQAANAYLAEFGRAHPAWRIDVIAIDLARDGRVRRLDHYESAVEQG